VRASRKSIFAVTSAGHGNMCISEKFTDRTEFWGRRTTDGVSFVRTPTAWCSAPQTPCGVTAPAFAVAACVRFESGGASVLPVISAGRRNSYHEPKLDRARIKGTGTVGSSGEAASPRQFVPLDSHGLAREGHYVGRHRSTYFLTKRLPW
jgi:hypothetical protein